MNERNSLEVWACEVAAPLRQIAREQLEGAFDDRRIPGPGFEVRSIAPVERELRSSDAFSERIIDRLADDSRSPGRRASGHDRRQHGHPMPHAVIA